MKVSFDITLKEQELLKKILDCKSAKELKAKINLVAKASLSEYIDMIIGKKAFTRGKDIMEYRLFLLTKYLYQEMIPIETDISSLFQLTPSESRTLVKSTISKYQYQIRSSVESTIKQILISANGNDTNGYEVIIYNATLKDEMNKSLSKSEGTFPMVVRDSGMIDLYKIKPSSYAELCKIYNIKITND